MSFPVLREILALNSAAAKGVWASLPKNFVIQLFRSSNLSNHGPIKISQKVFGQVTLDIIENLGPVYGKLAQIALSRLPENLASTAEAMELTRLYGDWEPIPFREIELTLDRNFSNWRDNFKISTAPLGVASIAQVHAATDIAGRDWVIKIVKPQAKRRMAETTAALKRLVNILRPLAIPSAVLSRLVKDVDEMISALQGEIDLNQEKQNIVAIKAKQAARKKNVLKIPEIFDEFCNKEVLVIERFHGTPLSDIVRGKKTLPLEHRKKLAARALHEMLVQVFELGLFHADPHAGNLIYLEDGNIGLFDWGLAGQLSDADRETIALLLKAVMHRDSEKLESALMQMSEREGKVISQKKLSREIDSLKNWFLEQKTASKKPGLADLFNRALKCADKLGIAIPGGLLMMVKALVTIEGLGKGLDPDISLAKVAMPVLIKAAKPGFGDFVKMGLSWNPLAKFDKKEN